MKKVFVSAVALVMMAAIISYAAGGYNSYTESMFTFPVHDADGEVIRAPELVSNGEARLHLNKYSAFMGIDAHGLTPGDAVTSWWVVFNHPELCSDGVCGEDDVFEHPELATVSVVYGQGRIIDENGHAFFMGMLSANDVTHAVFGPGLTNLSGAEIHYVLRSHGPADPDILGAQLHSMNGGCDPEPPHAPCLDLQFAIFKQGESEE